MAIEQVAIHTQPVGLSRKNIRVLLKSGDEYRVYSEPLVPLAFDPETLDTGAMWVASEPIDKQTLVKWLARHRVALGGVIETISAPDAISWIDTEVTDLASAKVALKKMVVLLIALRDELWPDMHG